MEIMVSVRGTFSDAYRKLMDTASEDTKEQHCEEYDGFYLFIALREDLASSLAKGILVLPKHH